MDKQTRKAIGFVLLALLFSASGCSAGQPVKEITIPPGSYVVLENDDLSNVAVRAYGDMDLWYTLLNANPQVGRRPRFFLEVGETIDIPPRDKLDKSLPKSVFPERLPADYIVMPGDSLHFIAHNVYGDRELWTLIYEANRSVLSERVKQDTRQLIAGQVLHIPAKPSTEQGARSGEKEQKSSRAVER